MKQDSYLAEMSRRRFIRQAACAGLGTFAMSNCIRDLHLFSSALAQGPYSDYKALVCIFLAGGNDSNNMIIPINPTEYSSYATIRTPVLAIPNAVPGNNATALTLSSANPDGHDYGLNPAMFEVAQMFNQTAGFNDLGKVAAVFNAGPLVFPMTKAQYVANSITKPPQLFSHSDQVTHWQTSIADQPPSSGWGGRMADLMHSYNPQNGPLDLLSTCVTIAGANTFQIGNSVQQYSVGTGGVVSLTNPSSPSMAVAARDAALNSILNINKTNVNPYTRSYAGALKGTIETGQGLSAALSSSQMAAYWSTRANWSKDVANDFRVITPNGGSNFASGLMQQLRMVAQIIEAGVRPTGVSNGLGMKRQIFFVQVGGYDTHTNQTSNQPVAGAAPTTNNAAVILGSQANLLAEISQCVWSFMKAIKQIGITYPSLNFGVNNVTCFTASDFGRTFPCNGLGSDHGWGSHHLIIGGAVDGKKTYGTFPTLAVGGPDDTSTGRWIPTISVDQYAATLAKWMGVDSNHIGQVFPNLTRFGGSYGGPTGPGYLGFMT